MKYGEAARPRSYRQTARAEAAAATRRRIVQEFLGLMRDRWLDEITLDAVAHAAGVTVQTVIRRFGGKEGLIRAAADLLSAEIPDRRAVPPGAIDRALTAVVEDYEITGDVVIRWLAEEPRHAVLRPLLDRGRAQHRAWVAEVFAPWLAPLAPADRERRLLALVAVADVYVWKLLRRDFGLAPAAVVAVLRELATKLVGEPARPPSA